MADHFESNKKLEKIESGSYWENPEYFKKNIH